MPRVKRLCHRTARLAALAGSTIAVIPADLIADAANRPDQWPPGARINLPAEIIGVLVYDVGDGDFSLPYSPPDETPKQLFLVKILGWTTALVGLGLLLYFLARRRFPSETSPP
jgi:hypothetical protein